MKLAAILACAFAFVLGIAIGIRRPCPQPVTELDGWTETSPGEWTRADADIQPPDPWPAAYWTTVGRA